MTTATDNTQNMPREMAQSNMPREIARFNMIEQQIRTWEVLDPKVLQLLNEVPREHFVPQAYQGLAFADIEIPIGFEQTMLSPKLEARMLQALEVKTTDNVLHIGTGSGYFTALLAHLAKHVVSLEINPELNATAAYQLSQHNTHNVTLELADGSVGLAAKQPFDVIVYTASLPTEPLNVRQQLAIGGRMLLVLGEAPVMQAMLITRQSAANFNSQVLFETCLPALSNAAQTQMFEF